MEIRRISVFGAGTMGHGIAQVAAQSGYDTNLFDIDEALVKRGLDRIAANLHKGVERGKVSEQQRDAALGRLGGTIELERAAQADLMIEAVPERIEIKADLFGRLHEMAPAEAVFASNTSSLSIAGIAAASGRPQQVLGMHFFNPVHIMQLLEIVVHDGTDATVLETAKQVGERMGKTAIVVKDSPGFATSRLGLVLGLEAMRMLEEGVASAADIDTAMELGYRHPMGPLRLTDLVGLDIRLGIADYLHEQLGSEAFRPPEILRAMVREGRLGRKSGRGFYDWPGND
jgi:3-hydroxybutyryl-CoA dehydrogenase